MIRFSDQPYRFFPPRYFGPTAWVIRHCNRRWLRTKLRINRLSVEDAHVLQGLPAGARLVLLPNHPTHCDASIILEACRCVGIRPRVMAAYDLYSRGLIDGWVMKRVGCFSVDREGSDKPALEEASRTILEVPAFKLTIFPEGNVYLENDRITPFHDGASFLSVRAAKQLAEKNVRVFCVPISIKVSHLTDCRAELREQLHGLAKAVGVRLDDSVSALEALRLIGLIALRNELARRHITLPNVGDLPTLTQKAAEQVLTRIEPQLKLAPRADDTPLERVRAARRVIHEIRTDPERLAEHAHAAELADDAMLAFRIASYSGDYVAERPTLDRIGETIEKLYEDLHDHFLPPYAPRQAVVRFNPPIDVTGMLDAGTKQKQVITHLTDDLEAACQRGLDETNRHLHTPGTERWTTPLSDSLR
jgi:1-acyl-sn-glycerol-3-phosphate acyltransferase